VLKYFISEEFWKAEVRELTDVELERTLVVTELAFSERVVVIEIVVKRLADEILHVMLEGMYIFSSENLLGNVDDAVLPHLPDSHHHTSRISELGQVAGLIFLQCRWAQLYAYL
jgi:hypothetical protein